MSNFLQETETVETILMADTPTNTNHSTPIVQAQALTGSSLLLLIVGLVIGGIGVWFVSNRNNKNQTSSENQFLSTFNEEGQKETLNIPLYEFAVDILATNIRMSNYMKIDVQATAFVAVNPNQKDKAIYFFGGVENLNLPTLNTAIAKRAESAIRGAIAKRKTSNNQPEELIELIIQEESHIAREAQDALKQSLEPLGLIVNDLVIINIEENEEYNPNNYLDALALEVRTERLQKALKNSREKELATEQAIRKAELTVEQAIRKAELTTEQVIRIEELNVGETIEQEEVKFEASALNRHKALEIAKLNQEQIIEGHRLKVEADLQIKEEEENTKVEQAKIVQDTLLAGQNKDFQLTQIGYQQEIETREILMLAEIIKAEQQKLQEQGKRMQIEEQIKTILEAEKASCRLTIAKLATETTQEEANAIKLLTSAEGERYHLIPPNDAARMTQLIQELAPQIIEKLPEFAQLLEALAPKSDILGNNNYYTFPNEKGDGINQLMLSTSGILFLNALMEGKLGQLIEQALQSVNNGQNKSD